MSSNQSGEGQIREAMVRGDVVEVMVALHGQLFLNTQIPVCLWFLTNDKTQRGRDRRGETLFIDARQMGTMKTRVERVLTDEDIEKIAGTVHAWRGDGEVPDPYEDAAGFCYSAKLEEIEKNGFVLAIAAPLNPRVETGLKIPANAPLVGESPGISLDPPIPSHSSRSGIWS